MDTESISSDSTTSSIESEKTGQSVILDEIRNSWDVKSNVLVKSNTIGSFRSGIITEITCTVACGIGQTQVNDESDSAGSILRLSYAIDGQLHSKWLPRNHPDVKPTEEQILETKHRLNMWTRYQRVQPIIRWEWRKGSSLYIRWNNGWKRGRVTTLNDASLSSIPPPLLEIEFYSNGHRRTKEVDRNDYHNVQPLVADIEDKIRINQSAFWLRRLPFKDINDLSRGLDFPFGSAEFRRVLHVWSIMAVQRDEDSVKKEIDDNWLTPRSAWDDLCRLLTDEAKQTLIGLDPFVGKDAVYLDYLQQKRPRVKVRQYVTDFAQIEFIPRSMDYIVGNPPYSYRFLRDLFIKLRKMDTPFCLLIPKWAIARQCMEFFHVFDNAVDDLMYFQCRKYRFELYHEETRTRERLKIAPFEPIWIFYRMNEYLEYHHRTKTDIESDDGKKHSIWRMYPYQSQVF